MLSFVYSNNFFTFRVGLTFLILQYIYVVIQLMLQHTCINKIGSVQYRAAGASRSSDAAFRQHYCGHVFFTDNQGGLPGRCGFKLWNGSTGRWLVFSCRGLLLHA